MTTNHSLINHKLWQAGLNLEAYVDAMAHKQEPMRRRLQSVALSAEQQSFFAAIDTPLFMLVMTEDWCPDSLMNLPILAAIAKAAPQMQLRIFPRSLHPELESEFSARGIQNIPLFAFYDGAFNEIGVWVERSQAAHRWLADWNIANPQLNAILHDETLSKDERRTSLAPWTAKKQQEMELAYEQSLQGETVAEIRALLIGQAVC